MTKSFKYYFDEKAADRVINWIEKYITHTKGELAGKSLVLDEWQKNDIIRPLFGWKDKITHLRQYRTIYVELPRKNAKSTLGGALGLLLLMADGEPGAEIYSAAADRQQAGIIFDIASSMVKHRKKLSDRAQVFRNSIVYEKTGSFYKVISADSRTKHGFNSHANIIDEVHAQPDRKLYDVLTTSVGSRRQPLNILFTTAGDDLNSICFELHEYARKLREGIIEDDTFLSVIYAADKDDDIYDPKIWKKANPGLGSTIKIEYFEDQINKVKNNPNLENTFRQLHLNQWVSSLTAWVPDAKWMECNQGEIDLNKLKGQECILGMDLASTEDTTSLAQLFPPNDIYNFWCVLLYVWVPEEMVNQRFARGDKYYRTWVDRGFMYQTPGNVTDYDFVQNKVLEINDDFNITKFGFDKWNSSQMVIALINAGVDEEVFDKVEMNIGNLSHPTKEMYKMIMNKQFNHSGAPVLRWMVSNVIIYTDANENIRPSKKSSKDKIDGVMSMIIAMASHLSDEDDVDINEYYKDGLNTI